MGESSWSDARSRSATLADAQVDDAATARPSCTLPGDSVIPVQECSPQEGPLLTSQHRSCGVQLASCLNNAVVGSASSLVGCFTCDRRSRHNDLTTVNANATVVQQ